MIKVSLKHVKRLLLWFFVFGIACLLFFFDSFSFLELKSYDSRMKFASRFIEPSEEICFIALDQESLDWAKEEMGWNWPWPRSAYADIVNYFSLANPKALVFDVLFTEPSVYGSEDDEIFATACRENGKVIHTLFEDTNTGKILLPIPSIKEAAADIGFITSTMDDDDIIRRAKFFSEIGGNYYNSLGYAPLFLSILQNPEEYLAQGIDFSELFIDTIGKNFTFLQDDLTVNLRFQNSLDDYLPYRASDILKSYYALIQGETPILPPENFTDTYTFFAFYAPGLFDICSVPNNQVYPGVGVHITLLDNLLNNQFIQQTPWYVSLLWIFFLSAFGFLSIYISEKQKQTQKSILSIVLISILSIGFILFVSYGLFAFGIWIPLVLPLFTFVLSFISALMLSYSQEGKQRRFIKNAFQQYVSPSVIENLIQNPSSLRLGGEKRNLSIFFSDIQGFTSISENVSPEELTDFLNDFLSEMSNIIMKLGGTIDKYEGDAIIAFWNAPATVENHQVKALTAALECQKRLEEMQAVYTYRLGSPVYMRIGINSGEAVVGNLGSRERFDYTMIGDSVNLASRLEGLNKEFGTYTMCSKTTKDAAMDSGADFSWRELARVAVVGRKSTVTVYEPLSKEQYLEKKEILEIFDKGRELFYKGDLVQAKEIFSSIEKLDKPAAAYVKKCNKLLRHLQKDMSLDSWEGIWIASTK